MFYIAVITETTCNWYDSEASGYIMFNGTEYMTDSIPIRCTCLGLWGKFGSLEAGS